MKNWNRMQNAAGILSMGGIRMIATWNLTTYVFLSHVRNIGMKSVTYWYQFFTRCEELVPILHGVKFTKSEIYGSTALIWKLLKMTSRFHYVNSQYSYFSYLAKYTILQSERYTADFCIYKAWIQNYCLVIRTNCILANCMHFAWYYFRFCLAP